MRQTIAAASAIAAVLLLAACGGASGSASGAAGSTASESPTPTASTAASASASPPPGYESLVVGGKVTTANICDAYTDTLTKFTENANAQLKTGNKYLGDPYTAAKFVNAVKWVDVDSEERLAILVDTAATSALNIVTDGQAGQVAELAPYIADSMDACGLTTAYTTAKVKASEVNDLAADLNSEAEDKPWYPKGYDEYYGDESLAWKWTEESCGYSSGYCWTMRVVSRDGCYNGLYGEINIEKNGVVIDYTNDVIGSLGAGKTAKLSFVHFDSGQGTLQGALSELTCNS